MEQEVIDLFISLGLPQPNLYFDFCLFDKAYAKDVCDVVPLREKRVNGNYQPLPGVYAFIDDNEKPEVMYIGKAIRLKNRLQTHHNRSEWIYEWAAMREIEGKTFNPQIAIWFTTSHQRAKLESELINKIHPYFNIRME